MPMQRIFLGWNGPMLPLAVRWLEQRYAQGHDWDLSKVLVIVPGARAGRRLVELLVEQASREPVRAMVPPRVMTTGSLPEALYQSDKPMASELSSLLTRASTLRELAQRQPEVISSVFPKPPEDDDFMGWLALARELAQLQSDLFAEQLEPARVPVLCEVATDFSFADDARWQALATMQEAYEAAMQQAGVTDTDLARRDALRDGSCAFEGQIVLLGTADLSGIARAMLDQLADDRVTALIHAPPSEAASFDAHGCVLVDAWHRNVSILPEQWHVVDRPGDQACEVVRIIGSGDETNDGLSEGLGSRYTAEQITVGIGDETAFALTHRTLELAGLEARSSAGTPGNRTRPAMLLEALSRYAQHGQLAEFADLLRHPDVEAFVLLAPQGEVTKPTTKRAALGRWLSLMDDYITQQLRGHRVDSWLGDEKYTEPLKAIHDRVMSPLLSDPEPQGVATLSRWATLIATFVQQTYGWRSLSRNRLGDRQLAESLAQIGAVLSEFASLNAGLAENDSLRGPIVSLSQALKLVLWRLAQQQLAPEPSPGAIELLGWLELQLDDAPALIITGFNEGMIPQSRGADALLPDRVRRHLKLTDNRRRYARDCYALTAILASRPDVVLVSGRRGGEDEPLSPSRLLLACDDRDLASRVLRFYKHDSKHVAPLLFAPGERSTLALPMPAPLREPITSMSVTQFRAYLQCPYRFYLQHALKLQGSSDEAVELDALGVGDLLHKVFELMARDRVISRSTNARDIEEFLVRSLHDLVVKRFGPGHAPAVEIQRLQLEYRLHHFAHWQAEQTRGGWRILTQHVEAKVATSLMVDDEPFGLRGRIDRIDFHEQLGLRVCDYKTGDSGKKPKETHGSMVDKQYVWTDLQLPLYRELIATLSDLPRRVPVSLGYILLPKDVKKVGFAGATWSDAELDQAIDVARDVVRKVRQEIFWPPSEAPEYEDDFSTLCLDKVADRAAIIRRSSVLKNSSSTGAQR